MITPLMSFYSIAPKKIRNIVLLPLRPRHRAVGLGRKAKIKNSNQKKTLKALQKLLN